MIFALVDDLFFSSKITGTARQLAREVRVFTTSDRLLQALEEALPGSISGVIVDLNCRSCSATDLIREIKQRETAAPLLGFFSHVQTELADAAREAGCDKVVPRSYFSAHLAEILSGTVG